jgi:hypothetical protein
MLINRQLAIGNRKSSGAFFTPLARATRLQRATFALSQLTTGAALQRPLVGTQTGATIDRQYALNFSMRARNHVNTNQLANSTRRCRACIRRRFDRTNVAAHKNRYVTCSDIFFSQQLNIRSFDHGVRGFDSADETFGLDHSECF